MSVLDWNYWRSMQVLPLWQAVMLSCNEEPGREELEDDELPAYSSGEADRRARIARNALGSGLPFVTQNGAVFLRSLVELAQFVAWANRLELVMPSQLARIDSSVGSGKLDQEDPLLSSNKAKSSCFSWLEQLIKSGLKQKTKSQYFVEAKEKFPGLSKRSFDEMWHKATAGMDAWTKPGRRSKRNS